jgi:hypothetical protein
MALSSSRREGDVTGQIMVSRWRSVQQDDVAQ